ncbi:MAG: hypothetical protein EBS96_04660 [Spartobacteria bacterium]|nr:hypothetical protein [Spartobacteria bacterium]
MTPLRPLFLLAVALLTISQAQAIDVTSMERVPVQEGGRKKPFIVFADEALMSISGKSQFTKEGTKISSTVAISSDFDRE